MDETESADVVTAGQRLREAREAKKLTIEDIAAQTRIPTRHLASLEAGDWEKLPAPTYSIGFAKNYASAVGLDRNEIGEQLRTEMGGTRPAAMAHPEIYEAADPARTMPKGLVFGAIALLVLAVIGLTWINDSSLESNEATAEVENVAAPPENVVAPAEPAPASAAGPVVLTATDAVWLEVRDGATVLKQGQLAPGETFEVPANAVAPVITTGKPEALRIAVGSQQAPPIGEPGRTVSRVSLKPADLLRAGPAPAATSTPQLPATPPAAAPARPRAERRTPPAPPTAAPPDSAAPAEGNSSPANSGPAGEATAQQ
jgi:transcriptional regulator with XRE-family HTH domain